MAVNSNTILLHISTALPCLKCYNAKLQLRLIRNSCTYAAYINPALNRNSAIQHYECSNLVKICRNKVRFLPWTVAYS